MQSEGTRYSYSSALPLKVQSSSHRDSIASFPGINCSPLIPFLAKDSGRIFEVFPLSESESIKIHTVVESRPLKSHAKVVGKALQDVHRVSGAHRVVGGLLAVDRHKLG